MKNSEIEKIIERVRKALSKHSSFILRVEQLSKPTSVEFYKKGGI